MYIAKLRSKINSMIRDILFDSSVNTVNDFKEKLSALKSKRDDSSYYFLASLEAETLLREIDRELRYRKISSIKFVVYPNNSGVDLFFGEDIDHLSKRFGWTWKELSNV